MGLRFVYAPRHSYLGQTLRFLRSHYLSSSSEGEFSWNFGPLFSTIRNRTDYLLGQIGPWGEGLWAKMSSFFGAPKRT